MRFIQHLLRLRLMVLRQQVKRSSTTAWQQRIAKLLAFGLVGLSGVVVNTLALWMFTQPGQHHYLVAAVLATEFSTTWNFLLTETLVFRGVKPGTWFSRGIRFYLVNHLALLLRLPILALLVSAFGLGVLIANVITLALLFLFRFVIADAAIYAKAEAVPLSTKQPMRIIVDPAPKPVAADDSLLAISALPSRMPATARKHLPYRYSIDGLITIGSQVPLPELEYFRAQWVGSDVDMAIRIGRVGNSAVRSRALMTQYTSPPAIRYEEHVRGLGANFHVEIGDPIEVVCSPALASSPHVLYTNVIEALLRFLAVSKDKILLHSACLELNGHGLLLSARTDTGKTGSVLRLVREYGAKFLSDDMTIIAPDGTATCFPKPLTISHHTLRAVNAGDLSPSEWRRLKLQSRLHSKEGRQFGMLLASLNIPIMGINSLTQRIVPPPKYDVDRLVAATIIRHTTVRDLFVIERGEPGLHDIEFTEGIDTLVENTDDAYGFPPFKQMAPSIAIGQADYAQLRIKERSLMEAAMRNIRMRRLGSNTFSWADDIANLLGTGADTDGATETATADGAAAAGADQPSGSRVGPAMTRTIAQPTGPPASPATLGGPLPHSTAHGRRSRRPWFRRPAPGAGRHHRGRRAVPVPGTRARSASTATRRSTPAPVRRWPATSPCGHCSRSSGPIRCCCSWLSRSPSTAGSPTGRPGRSPPRSASARCWPPSGWAASSTVRAPGWSRPACSR